MLCDRMDIDIWEVVDAAATKPFGFMKFQPGPGLGGHCIPIDPFYLSWKAREYDFCDRVHRARRQGQREHALLLRHQGDTGAQLARQGRAGLEDPACSASPTSPTSTTCASRRRCASSSSSTRSAPWSTTTTPSCPSCPSSAATRSTTTGRRHRAFDAVLIVTAHTAIDYTEVVEKSQLVVDFRSVTAAVCDTTGKVWKL